MRKHERKRVLGGLRKLVHWCNIDAMTVQTAGGVPEFTICDRLRKARELTGLDQGPFAKEIGVSRGTVSTYEREEDAAFKPIVMQAWALRTGVPVEWLLTGMDSGNRPTPPGGGRPHPKADLSELTERKIRRTRRGGATTDQYPAVA